MRPRAGLRPVLLLAGTLAAQGLPPVPGPDALRLRELEADTPVQIIEQDGVPPAPVGTPPPGAKPPLPRPLQDEPGPGWSGISWSVSPNDGLTISGGTFNGKQVVYQMSVPFFFYNTGRYELASDRLVSGPVVRRYLDGSLRVDASYRLLVLTQREPPQWGILDVTQAFHFANRPGMRSGTIKPWILFSGPSGGYDFHLRMDFDIRGASGDRHEEFQDVSGRGLWVANAVEYGHSTSPPFWAGFKSRSWDETGTDREDQTILGIAPYAPDRAEQHVVRYNGGETEGLPQTYANGETIQTLDGSTPLRNPVAGQDLVHWYRGVRSASSSGVIGPDISVGNRAPRRSLVEIDKLDGVNFPPVSISHHECTGITLESIYAGLIDLEVVRDQWSIPQWNNHSPFTKPELHNLMTANRSYWGHRRDVTEWHAHIAIVSRYTDSRTTGIMFDWGSDDLDGVGREGCAVFHDAIAASWSGTNLWKALLNVEAHELGHVFNLYHQDATTVGGPPWTSCARGNTIMWGAVNPVTFPDDALFRFSPASVRKLRENYDPYVMPGGLPFTPPP